MNKILLEYDIEHHCWVASSQDLQHKLATQACSAEEALKDLKRMYHLDACIRREEGMEPNRTIV